MPSSPKFFHQSRPSSRRSTVLILSCCLLIGLSGFVFGLIAILRPSRCPVHEPRSVRVVWEREGSGDGSNSDADGVRSAKRHKVMGFVGIQTGFGSAGRRRSLRQTWMPSDRQGLQRLEEATGLAFRFVIGRTKDQSKMSELKREVAEYADFLLLDIEEEYSMLPYKTLAFFKAAYALYDSEFYIKADDDIYLRPDRLSLLLAKERIHTQTYIGCMKKGQVFANPNLKWSLKERFTVNMPFQQRYEPLHYLLGSEYFLHAYGPLYALSADVVASLVALRNTSFRMFSNEDVTIGSWMLAMNVNHENSQLLCESDCTPSFIAVWDIPKCSGLCDPESRLLELHKKESCSRSPTMPSDDDD